MLYVCYMLERMKNPMSVILVLDVITLILKDRFHLLIKHSPDRIFPTNPKNTCFPAQKQMGVSLK